MVHRLSLCLCLLISFLISAINATSPLDIDIGLYHNSVRQAGAQNCSIVRLPWNLCPACKLKPFNGTGADLDFGADAINRFDIYDLDDPVCRNYIARYIEKNPCDTVRANAFETYKNGGFDSTKTLGAYKVMIYFMYSVCETCCDCIPIGSKVDEYEERKENGTLTHITRGNCAAHFHYDTCRIWPNAGQIQYLNGKEFSNKTPWCGDFDNWLGTPDSKGWLKNNDVKELTWLMKKAMNQMMKRARCDEETQWKNCVRMEKAQNRV